MQDEQRYSFVSDLPIYDCTLRVAHTVHPNFFFVPFTSIIIGWILFLFSIFTQIGVCEFKLWQICLKGNMVKITLKLMDLKENGSELLLLYRTYILFLKQHTFFFNLHKLVVLYWSRFFTEAVQNVMKGAKLRFILRTCVEHNEVLLTYP